MKDPAIDGFLQRRKAGRGWIIFFTALYFLTLVAFTVLSIRLAHAFEMRPRFVIIDQTGTLVVSQEQDFESAKALHVSQAELAVQTMFGRNPGGLDSEERLKRLFDRPSFEKFRQIVQAQTPEFEAKNLHQKAEIAETKILKLQDRSVRVAVYGQLIRTGYFDGQPFSEALAMKVTLLFTHNPSFIQSGRFPTVVRDFDIHTEPVPAQ